MLCRISSVLITCILPGSFLIHIFCPDIPAQARKWWNHALSRHELSYNPPMQTPGIRSNIQNTRPAVPVYRCGVSLLYIKQLYTQPCVSCCQPPKSMHNPLCSFVSLSPASPAVLAERASHCVQTAFISLPSSGILALTLFVLRILTDYSDASFSFNNLAFFTNWFYWWSNLHVKSSFHTC